jgi:hypothetical protein
MSTAKLAATVPLHPDAIAKYEKALRRPDRSIVVTLDQILKTEGALLEDWDRAAEQTRPSTPHQATTQDLVQHWTALLASLAKSGNAVGCDGLLQVVSGQIMVIDRHTSDHGRSPDLLAVQARWLEFGSWIADNHGDAATAATMLRRASGLALRADKPALSAYLSMRRSQRAWEAGSPRKALHIASAVESSLLPARVSALLAIRQSQAHATLKDACATRTAIATALNLLTRSCDDDPHEDDMAAHCTSDYALAHEAHCRLLLGEPLVAARLLENVLAGWPVAQRLDEGVFRAYLARAHYEAGAHDQALVQVSAAARLATETGSRRIQRLAATAIRRDDLQQTAGHDVLEAMWHTQADRRRAERHGDHHHSNVA